MSMTNSVADIFIQRLECFGPLPEADKARVNMLKNYAEVVVASTDLVQQGEPPTDVFLVLEGFACRYKLGSTGIRQITALLLPGDFCDVDVSLLVRMDHSIGTLSKCRVARISKETILGLLEYPALARAVRMSTLVETANAREWIVNIGRRSSLERTAHLLCELHFRLKAVGLVDGYTFHLPLTQKDLAETTGMSVVHMNRSIKHLCEADLVSVKGKNLSILDLPELQRRADFDPSYLHLREMAIANKVTLASVR